MLVLTRLKDQTVEFYDARTKEFIGRITVVEARGGKVKLGIEFPIDYDIVRDNAKEREARDGHHDNSD